MRAAFCDAMVLLAREKSLVFLTGDLGFMALEPLAQALGPRFINAGVSEQNMISVAAGMAHEGTQPWVYSIAPFCYARPFEQIRNDICLNRLPVCLVGNGGGYAYGAMGATHHALEDYGVLLSLPEMQAYVPAFDADVEIMVQVLASSRAPGYLRLGRSELNNECSETFPEYAPWRQLHEGDRGVMLVVGPIAGSLWREMRARSRADRPALWVVSELGSETRHFAPRELLGALDRAAFLCIVEEHVAQGGFGQRFVHSLASSGQKIPPFVHAHARGYVSGRYGSQQWHRKESGLDLAAILQSIDSC